jgi:sugar phosphate isomerase/epimerase
LDIGGAIEPGKLSQTGRREIASVFRSREVPLVAVGSGLRKALDEPDNHEERLARINELARLAADLGGRGLILPSGDPVRAPNATDAVGAPKAPEAPRLSPLLGGEIRLRRPLSDPRSRTQVLDESLEFLTQLAGRQGLISFLDPGSHDTVDLFARLQEAPLGELGLVWDPATQLAAGRRPEHFLSQGNAILGRGLFVSGRDWLMSQAQETVPGTGDVGWEELIVRLAAAGYGGYITAQGANFEEVSATTSALAGLLPLF